MNLHKNPNQFLILHLEIHFSLCIRVQKKSLNNCGIVLHKGNHVNLSYLIFSFQLKHQLFRPISLVCYV